MRDDTKAGQGRNWDELWYRPSTMTEKQMRDTLAELCAEIDQRNPGIVRGRLFRSIVLPAALSTGLAFSAGCEATPIELPYMGPLPDGLLLDLPPRDLGLDLAPDAGADLGPDDGGGGDAGDAATAGDAGDGGDRDAGDSDADAGDSDADAGDSDADAGDSGADADASDGDGQA